MSKLEEYSSPKVNVEKCEACWISGIKKNRQKPLNCRWISLAENTIRIPSIHFSYNEYLAEKENFVRPTVDCRSLLNIWKQGRLSLADKIQIYKSVIASRPVYAAT